MRDVFIAGVGQTAVTRDPQSLGRYLGAAAVNAALADAGIEPSKIGALYVGNMLSGILAQQQQLGGLIADYTGLPGIEAVTNPLAAIGGRDPEPASQIRVNAPQAFRAVTHRAVQPADYVDIARRLPWVQQAGAVMRWTGSWPTVFVTPDPRDAVGLGAEQRRELEALMDRVRQAGREVKVRDPRYADIDLEIRVCVAPNAYPGEVKEAVLEALFGGPMDGGLGGFFDPDNFSFGTALSRAALIAAIQAVPGVKAVEGMRVRRRAWFDWRAFDEFSLPVGVDELVRVGNSRELPERGAVRLVMDGGA